MANQFWWHKNHLIVVDAVARLRRKGIRIPVVMTGLPADDRDPKNGAVSAVLQAIASGGLTDQVKVLGLVSSEDLINLLKTAAVIVQPLRFEGWNATVQDAKALGRPIICSDIPVHREQAPGAAGFFPCNRPNILADLLAEIWPSLEPGVDKAMEKSALACKREFANRFSEVLLSICEEAHSL